MKILLIILNFLVVMKVATAQSNDAQFVDKSEHIYSNLSELQRKEFQEVDNFQKLQYEAKKGNPESLYKLAFVYRDGKGTAKNLQKSYELLTKSAKLGYSKAWTQLGFYHKYGVGRKVDYKEAFNCFKVSAELNELEGIYLKGYMLYKGFGVNQDYALALQEFRKGEALNHAGCMYMLGLCYRNGFGIEANLESATYWLNKSADLGFLLAKSELETKTPEYNPLAQDLIDKVNIANGIAEKAQYQVDKFNKIVSKSPIEKLEGVFEGYLLMYDWSGTKIIEATEIFVEMETANESITGKWSEVGNPNIMTINGDIKNNKIMFKDMFLVRNNHYYQVNPLKYQFVEAELQSIKDNAEEYLMGSLSLYVPTKHEPQHPTSVVLRKRTDNQNMTQSNLETKITSFLAYPNPFEEVVNVEFKFSQASVTSVSIHNSEGKTLKTINALELTAGKYNLPIMLNVPSGSYYVTLCVGTELKSLTIIKP